MIRRNARLTVAATTLVLAATSSEAQSILTQHVRDAVRAGAAQPMADLPRQQTMSLDIVVPLRDPAGLDAFLADIYNPKSPNFRHFLTVPEFTARFGPTQEN